MSDVEDRRVCLALQAATVHTHLFKFVINNILPSAKADGSRSFSFWALAP